MKPNKQLFSFWWKSFSIWIDKIYSKELKMKFRKKETDFTRDRKLPFEKIITLILQKWVKSLQLRLNEFSIKLSDKLETITASAYVQAKNKLSYELFMELDLDVVINRYYDLKENEYWYETWENYRILATDGSQLRLPEEKEVIKKYWTTKIKNSKWDQWEYCHWLLSVIYDPLNNLALNKILEKWKYSERALAIKNIINLEKTTIKIKEKDLILYDRWYYSSFLFATILSFNKDYVCRIQKNSCKEVKELFEKDCKINSKIIELDVVNKEKEYEKNYWIKLTNKLEKIIKVRFVRVILSTGDIEVLATSLLNDEKYENKLFKKLYFQRWWIEIYYDLLKNRLLLENFTWKNVESVLQDLYSSIYLSNFQINILLI